MIRRLWPPADPDGSTAASGVTAEAVSRALLAATGAGAALVLYASWSTVKAPYDAALTLGVVVGIVHGLLGWVPRLRIPARPAAVSALPYGVVLLLFLLLTPERLGGSAASVLNARLAVGVVVAVAVHGVLAEPSRRQGRFPGWRGVAVLALLPGLVGAAVLGAYGLPGRAHPVHPEEALQLTVGGSSAGGAESVAEALTFPVDGPTAVAPTPDEPASPGAPQADVTTTAPSSRSGLAAKAGPRPTPGSTAPAPAQAAPSSTATTAPHPRPVKILISGESTAGATGGGIRTWGQKNGRADVEVVGSNGCALQQDGVAILRDGWTQPKNGPCLYLIDYTVEVATKSKPDLIILFIGSNQLSDWLLPDQTVANHIGEPAFDQLYTNAATAALGKLGSLGIPVLFTTVPVPAWDPAVQTGDPNVPGTGPIKMNDAGRTRRLNELTAAVVRGLPLTSMAPYAERISNPDGTVPSSIRPDGVHLKQEAVPAIMDRGLENDLRGAYQQVATQVPSAGHAGHAWSKS